MHTIYTGASPEYGKESFLSRLASEVAKIRNLYLGVPLIGLTMERYRIGYF